MPLNAEAIQQIEFELATARGNYTAGQVDAEISKDTKLIAAAISQAGAEIALAIASQGS